jgi:AAA+ superfamily predicted ATPase
MSIVTSAGTLIEMQRCPMCKKGVLLKTKKMMGLGSAYLRCNSCRIEYHGYGPRYAMRNIPRSSQLARYLEQSLSAVEIARIGNGGPSDTELAIQAQPAEAERQKIAAERQQILERERTPGTTEYFMAKYKRIVGVAEGETTSTRSLAASAPDEIKTSVAQIRHMQTQLQQLKEEAAHHVEAQIHEATQLTLTTANAKRVEDGMRTLYGMFHRELNESINAALARLDATKRQEESEIVGPEGATANLRFAQFMKDAMQELTPPLETIRRGNPQFQYGETGGALQILQIDFFRVAAYCANADGEFSDKELAFILDIHTLFTGEVQHVEANAEELAAIRGALTKEDVMKARSAGELVSILGLQAYDLLNRTSHAEKAKTVYYRLVETILRADGEMSAAKQSKLSEFTQSLWPHASVSTTTQARSETASETHKRITAQTEPANLSAILAELNSLIGLDAVKTDVIQLVNYLKVQQLKHSKGMRSFPVSLHYVFYGNPGTGKTTVARLLAQIYQSLGLLSKGHLVETDRSGLVAGYLGQTALKVNEVVSKALGGILFIDEAYSLTKREDSFGEEAIEVLIKQMEDHRDDLIVIVAGYTDKMDEFLSSNPGLHSRFNKYLKFQDYGPAELAAIFERFAAKEDMHLSTDAREKLQSVFQTAYNTRDNTFGNGRLARNLYERVISNQANRIVSLSDVTDLNLSTIEAEDIPVEVSDSGRLT